MSLESEVGITTERLWVIVIYVGQMDAFDAPRYVIRWQRSMACQSTGKSGGARKRRS